MSSLRARRQEAITVALVFAVLCWTTIAFADFTGKVVRVMDGDTLEVLTQDMTPIRVRLSGIDCPEKGQAFGQRAKQAASDLAFGKTVEVRDKGRDRYGRTAGEVILEDGRSLNRELVRAGLAWWYRQYAKKDADLARLEKEAREAKLGLWADADPLPPWNWRKERKPK
jgi:micrococcal nuclease